MYIRRYIYPEA